MYVCVSAVNVLVCLCSVSGLCIYCIEGRGINYDPVCVLIYWYVQVSVCGYMKWFQWNFSNRKTQTLIIVSSAKTHN